MEGVKGKDLDQFKGELDNSAPEKPIVAPGHDAKRPFVVQYQGPWETEFDSVCRAVRRHAVALAGTGCPVLLESFTHQVRDRQGGTHTANLSTISEGVLNEVGGLYHTEGSVLCPRIKHLVVRDLDHLLRVISPPSLFTGFDDVEAAAAMQSALFKSTITYTVWERDRIPSEMARILARCGDNWVPSHANAKALIRSGVPEDKVCVLPHPISENDKHWVMRSRASLPPTMKGLKNASKRFYAISKWEPRKAFDRLMLAFMLAFSPGEDATLVIKTSKGVWKNYSTPVEILEAALGDERVRRKGWTESTLVEHMRVFADNWSESRIHELHFRSTHYVSCSHAEGFGLGAMEALTAGNHLVFIEGQGGVDDFAPKSAQRVPSFPASCHESYGWKGAEWREFDVQELADAMARAPAGLPGERDMADLSAFSMTSVGARMAERVLRVAEVQPGCRESLELEIRG